MSVNLIELVKGQLGDSVMDQLGGMLGESAENTKSALDAGIPTILGSIVDKVSNDSEAGGMLSKVLDDMDDGIADDFTSFLQPEKQESLMKQGGGLLSGLLGDNMGGVVDMISKFSGIGSKSSSSLLGMAMPLVLGFISKQRSAGGLDQAGVLGLLSDQKDSISAAMPQGMTDLLGKSGMLSGLTNMVSGGVQNVAQAAGDAADAVSGAVTDGADKMADMASAAKETVADAASATTDAVGDAAGAVKDTAADMASGAADAAGQAASAGGSMLRKILPIAVAVLVILFLLKQCA